MLVVSSAQMRELDRVTIVDFDIASATLMERAAAAVVEFIGERHRAALMARIGVLCGPGNNGGDGHLVARRLRESGCEVAEFTLGGARPWLEARAAMFDCALLVDALFGTGLSRPLTGEAAVVVADLNRDYHGPVIAVDMPSGLGSDGEGLTEAADAPVLRAAATITFTRPKLGQFLSRQCAATGELRVASIGTPDAFVDALPQTVRLTTPDVCRPCFAARARDANKGSYGHVAVVAGSIGKAGAAILASTAALRAGAGLVTAVVPMAVLPTVAGARAEVMTAALPATVEACLKTLIAASVVALGPGLGREPEVAGLIRALVRRLAIPVVLDADGLNAFEGLRGELVFSGAGVVTPHPGEMARLFAATVAEVQQRRLYYAQRLAAESGAVVVLKGHRTLVVDASGSTFINASGNPGMATGGSGDVLTGVIAGLLAQFPQRNLLETVAAAVYWHGRAGDRAARRCGEMSLIAGDIIDALGAAGIQLRTAPLVFPYDLEP